MNMYLARAVRMIWVCDLNFYMTLESFAPIPVLKKYKMDRKQKTALKNKKYRDKKRNEFKNMGEEVDRLRSRVEELERKVMEQESLKTFVVTNHPDVYEEYERAKLLKNYVTEPAAMADDLDKALEGFFEEHHVDDEALVEDIDETVEFF